MTRRCHVPDERRPATVYGARAFAAFQEFYAEHAAILVTGLDPGGASRPVRSA